MRAPPDSTRICATVRLRFRPEPISPHPLPPTARAKSGPPPENGTWAPMSIERLHRLAPPSADYTPTVLDQELTSRPDAAARNSRCQLVGTESCHVAVALPRPYCKRAPPAAIPFLRITASTKPITAIELRDYRKNSRYLSHSPPMQEKARERRTFNAAS